ncbi:MAG: hypothetical protein PHP44_03405 [Kiritimatiellae bacterium]|nr:hypothetical protein [Kiritimatiellia bacterium]MDD4735136.1 hypothetical protein [Kiritimatiellia bacterium]
MMCLKSFSVAALSIVLVGTVLADVPVGQVTSKYDITIYGYIKLDAIYDSQKTAVGDLAFFVLPKVDGEEDSETRLTARQSRLGLKVNGPEVEGGRVTGLLEMDFYGKADSDNAYHPRMRLGYLDWAFSTWSLRAGQDWETFIVVVPTTINFATLSDQGSLGLRRPQFRLTKDFALSESSKLVLKGAVARTVGQDIDGGGQDDGVDSDIPTFQGAVVLQSVLLTEKKTVAGISGHWGKEVVDSYTKDDVTVDEKKYDSWSVIGSLCLPIIKQLSLVGTIWTGENLDTYYGGIGQGINPTAQKGIKATGGYAQIQVFPMDKVNVNFTYGVDDPKDGDLAANMRSKNETLVASIQYSFSSDLIVGLEYQYLETKYKDSDSAKDNRVQAAMTFKF